MTFVVSAHWQGLDRPDRSLGWRAIRVDSLVLPRLAEPAARRRVFPPHAIRQAGERPRLSVVTARTSHMPPTTDQLLELIHSLLDNAESLTSDARLLHDNGRHARSYALAALAGEELGKIGFCLDWLLGPPTLTAKEFRRSWQSHSEKLSSLTAYRTAFIEPVPVSFDDLREQFQTISNLKMQAIYVDFNESGVVTPGSISADEASALLAAVDAAVQHAVTFLRPLTKEIVAATNTALPTLLAPFVDYLEHLAPEQAIGILRDILRRLPSISSAEWDSAIDADTVDQLLGLDSLPRVLGQ